MVFNEYAAVKDICAYGRFTCIPLQLLPLLLYCDNFSTSCSLLTAFTHASIVHNHANCPWRLHSEHYDFVITRYCIV